MYSLSVIVPLYNGKEYIKTTVAEIKKIKCSKEIIVVDDGSTDGSYEYAVSCFENESNVKILKKKNGGIADSRNYGLERATGDFVLFVDQDDRVNPEAIDKAINILIKTDVSAVMWSTMFEYHDKTVVACDSVNVDETISREEILDVLIPALLSRDNCAYTNYAGHIWGGIFRKSVIENNKIRLKSFIDYEDDLIFIFDFLLKAKCIAFIRDVGYYWKVNAQSYSHANKHVKNYIKRSEEYVGYVEREYQRETGRGLVESVSIYLRQYTIIGAIKNCCAVGNDGKVEENNIILTLKQPEYYLAFKHRCAHIRDYRERIICYFARNDKARAVILLVKMYYEIMKMKKYLVK